MLKDAIYLVISGEYSDWSIEGYFDNREEALKYCAVVDTEDQYNNAYIQEVSSPAAPSNKLKYHKEFTIEFRKKNRDNSDQWVMGDTASYNYYIGKKKKTEIEELGAPWGFQVTVTTTTQKKAEKIAQDLFYQWRMENE